MKILKYLAIGIGIVFLVSIIIKMLQKGVATRIDYKGFVTGENKLLLDVYANGTVTNNLRIAMTGLQKQSLQINDYRLQITNIGTRILFTVFNDQNQNISETTLDVANAPAQTIFNEQ